MLHPILQLMLEEWRLEELRAEESARRQADADVPRWRRIAGRALLAAGRRLMGGPPAEVARALPADCGG